MRLNVFGYAISYTAAVCKLPQSLTYYDSSYLFACCVIKVMHGLCYNTINFQYQMNGKCLHVIAFTYVAKCH